MDIDLKPVSATNCFAEKIVDMRGGLNRMADIQNLKYHEMSKTIYACGMLQGGPSDQDLFQGLYWNSLANTQAASIIAYDENLQLKWAKIYKAQSYPYDSVEYTMGCDTSPDGSILSAVLVNISDQYYDARGIIVANATTGDFINSFLMTDLSKNLYTFYQISAMLLDNFTILAQFGGYGSTPVMYIAKFLIYDTQLIIPKLFLPIRAGYNDYFGRIIMNTMQITQDQNYLYITGNHNHVPSIMKIKLLNDENNIPDIQWQSTFDYGQQWEPIGNHLSQTFSFNQLQNATTDENYIFSGGDVGWRNVLLYLIKETSYSTGGNQPTLVKSWYLDDLSNSNTFPMIIGTYMEQSLNTFYTAISQRLVLDDSQYGYGFIMKLNISDSGNYTTYQLRFGVPGVFEYNAHSVLLLSPTNIYIAGQVINYNGTTLFYKSFISGYPVSSQIGQESALHEQPVEVDRPAVSIRNHYFASKDTEAYTIRFKTDQYGYLDVYSQQPSDVFYTYPTQIQTNLNGSLGFETALNPYYNYTLSQATLSIPMVYSFSRSNQCTTLFSDYTFTFTSTSTSNILNYLSYDGDYIKISSTSDTTIIGDHLITLTGKTKLSYTTQISFTLTVNQMAVPTTTPAPTTQAPTTTPAPTQDSKLINLMPEFKTTVSNFTVGISNNFFIKLPVYSDDNLFGKIKLTVTMSDGQPLKSFINVKNKKILIQPAKTDVGKYSLMLKLQDSLGGITTQLIQFEVLDNITTTIPIKNDTQVVVLKPIWSIPKLQSISQFGEAVINFDSDFNLKALLESKNLNKFIEVTTNPNYRISWQLKQNSDTQMTLKFDLQDKDSNQKAEIFTKGIDLQIVFKQIQLKVLPRNLQASNQELDYDSDDIEWVYWFMISQKVPLQIEDAQDFQQIKIFANVSTTFILVLLILQLLMVTIDPRQVLQLFWNFMNIMQLIIHLALFNLAMSPQLYFYVNQISWIYKYNIFEIRSDFSNIFNIIKEDYDLPFRYLFWNLGYETNVFAFNIGCFFIYFLIYLCMIGALGLAFLLKRSSIISKVYLMLKKFVVFDTILRILTQSFLISLLGCLLEFNNSEDQVASSTFLASIWFIINIVLLFGAIIFYMLQKLSSFIKSSTISYYQGNKRKSWLFQAYSSVFYWRRFIFVILIIWSQEYVALQLIINNLMSIFNTIFYLHYKPNSKCSSYIRGGGVNSRYKNSFLNDIVSGLWKDVLYFEILNELVFLIISDFIFGFTDFCTEYHAKLVVTNIIVIITGILTGINIAYQLWIVFRFLRYRILKQLCSSDPVLKRLRTLYKSDQFNMSQTMTDLLSSNKSGSSTTLSIHPLFEIKDKKDKNYNTSLHLNKMHVIQETEEGAEGDMNIKTQQQQNYLQIPVQQRKVMTELAVINKRYLEEIKDEEDIDFDMPHRNPQSIQSNQIFENFYNQNKDQEQEQGIQEESEEEENSNSDQTDELEEDHKDDDNLNQQQELFTNLKEFQAEDYGQESSDEEQDDQDSEQVEVEEYMEDNDPKY
eukprot:403374463